MLAELPFEQAGYAQKQRAHEQNRARLRHDGARLEIWAEIGRHGTVGVYRISQSCTRGKSILKKRDLWNRRKTSYIPRKQIRIGAVHPHRTNVVVAGVSRADADT